MQMQGYYVVVLHHALPLLLLMIWVVPSFGAIISSNLTSHGRELGAYQFWQAATATWYGSPEGDGSDGGACGYGKLVNSKPFKTRATAGSGPLFRGGQGCGSCYKVMCLDRSICTGRSTTVIVTDECPNGGPCAAGKTHFDLSGAAFGRLAISGKGGQLRNRGNIPIVYRRTPCKYRNKKITFMVNEGSSPYWFSILVVYEGGEGDVGSMQIRPANSRSWMSMEHSWGANWRIQANGPNPMNGPFSVRLTTMSKRRTLYANNVIPEDWSVKKPYSSRVNL